MIPLPKDVAAYKKLARKARAARSGAPWAHGMGAVDAALVIVRILLAASSVSAC